MNFRIIIRFYKVLFLFLGFFAVQSCGVLLEVDNSNPEEEIPVANTELQGKWEMGCKAEGGDYYLQDLTFIGNQLTATVTYFLDSVCDEKEKTIGVVYNFLLGAEISAETSARELDLTVISVSLIFHNDSAAKQANESSLYSLSDWVSGSAKDISTQEHEYHKVGSTVYTIYKIDGSNLYMGEGDAGATPESRPSTLEKTAFSKNEAMNDPVSGDSGSTDGSEDSLPVQIFPGYEFALTEGDFWKYSWDRSYQSSSGFGTSSSKSNGNGTFWIQLANPTVINGVTAYEMIYKGKTSMGDKVLAPRWKYIAISDHKILVSETGASMVTLFDAKTGKWPGSGFFTEFSKETEYTGSLSSLSNDYIQSDAIMVSTGSTSDQCEYDRLTGQTFCDDDGSHNKKVQEYYQGEVGVIGYHYYFNYSEMSYDWQYSSTEEINIGLVASSLTGDAFDGPASIVSVTPDAGTYNGAQTITIVTDPVEASVRYTTDGTDPSATSGIEVMGDAPKKITLNSLAGELRLIAYKDGWSASEVLTRKYTIINVLDFVTDENGFAQVFNNNIEQYGWSYYDLRDESYTTILSAVEIEVKRVSGSNYSAMGLIFCAQAKDLNNHYEFIIALNQKFSIFKVVDGVYTELVPWTYNSAIKSTNNTVNTLKVTYNSILGTFQLIVNGSSIKSFTDTTYKRGYNGFVTHIGDSSTEDFPDEPTDVRFRMISPVSIP